MCRQAAIHLKSGEALSREADSQQWYDHSVTGQGSCVQPQLQDLDCSWSEQLSDQMSEQLTPAVALRPVALQHPQPHKLCCREHRIVAAAGKGHLFSQILREGRVPNRGMHVDGWGLQTHMHVLQAQQRRCAEQL